MILRQKLYIHVNNFYFFKDLFLDHLITLSKKYIIFIITSQDYNKDKQFKILKTLKKKKLLKILLILVQNLSTYLI